MYCTKCGKEILEGQYFCTYCGQRCDLNYDSGESDRIQRKGSRGRKNKRKKKRRYIWLVLMLMLIILFVGIFLLIYIEGKQAKDPPIFIGDENLYYAETKAENVRLDLESGTQYAGNELILTAGIDVPKERVKSIIEENHGQIVGYISAANVYQIQLEGEYSFEELHEMQGLFAAYAEVDRVDLNVVVDYEISAYPNDSKWKDLWEDNPGGANWGMEAIHAPEAWDYFDQMEEVNVGVCDTMFREHEDLTIQEIMCNMRGMEFNSNHGTHVAGIIGAEYNNKKGVCGVFPKAMLYGASFERIEQSYESIMGMKIGLSYLICSKKCRVINISAGFPEITYGGTHRSSELQKSIDNWSSDLGDYLSILIHLGNDFVICKSAGNENDQKFVRADHGDPDAPYGYIFYNEDNKERYKKYADEEEFESRIEERGADVTYDLMANIKNPEVMDRIIIVGAAKNEGNESYSVADFSNYGERVDLVAPGVEIHSTVFSISQFSDLNQWVWSSYGNMDGTSMASPFVSGVAAMLYSINPELSGDQVKRIICETAEGEIRYSDEMREKRQELEKYSYHMVNAARAVERVVGENEIVEEQNIQKDSEYTEENRNGNEGMSDKQKAEYRAVIEQAEKQYGSYQLNRDNNIKYAKGVCYLELRDINKDGNPELFLVTNDGSAYEWGSPMVPECYRYEIWAYEDEKAVMLESDGLEFSNGGWPNVSWTEYQGRTNLVSNHSFYITDPRLAYYRFHGYREDGTFGVIDELSYKNVDTENGFQTVLYINGKETTQEEWDKEYLSRKENAESVCLFMEGEDTLHESVEKVRSFLGMTEEKQHITYDYQPSALSSYIGERKTNDIYDNGKREDVVEQIADVWQQYASSEYAALLDVIVRKEDEKIYVRFVCQSNSVNNGQPYYVFSTNLLNGGEWDWQIVSLKNSVEDLEMFYESNQKEIDRLFKYMRDGNHVISFSDFKEMTDKTMEGNFDISIEEFLF